MIGEMRFSQTNFHVHGVCLHLKLNLLLHHREEVDLH